MAGPWMQYRAQPGAAEGAKPWERYQTAPEPSASPAASQAAEKASGLSRLWDALISPSGKTAGGRFKMGLGDPVYGAAQMGAHMADVPLMSPEMPLVPADQTPPHDYAAELDKTVQGREQQYEEQRHQATVGANDPEAVGIKPRLATDWARLLGNVASPVNLAEAAAAPGAAGAVGRGVPLLTRMGAAAVPGAVAGATGGASQPVTGGQFAPQKLAQVGAGGTAGAALAPVGAAAGAGARTLLGRAPIPANQVVQRGLAQGVGIPTRGMNNSADVANFVRQGETVVRDIVANKDSLSFTGPKGKEVSGELPRTAGQASEVIANRKDQIFKEFDALAQKADASTDTPTAIGKFTNAYQAAIKRQGDAQKALSEANTKLTMAVAQQSRAGNNVYRSSAANKAYREAKDEFARADRALQTANERLETATGNIRKPWVDLKPVASALSSFTNDSVNRLTSKATRYAMELAQKYGKQEAWSGAEAQRAIKNLNAGLQAFYTNPSHDTVSHAAVDEIVASKLRQGLDEMVSHVTGADYQRLKNLYGAYSAVEKQFTRAAIRQLNRAEGGIFANAQSMGDVLSIATHLPAAGLVRVARILATTQANPDHAIANMFRGIERQVSPRAPSLASPHRSFLPTAAGTAAARQVGDTGPQGGEITDIQSRRLP